MAFCRENFCGRILRVAYAEGIIVRNIEYVNGRSYVIDLSFLSPDSLVLFLSIEPVLRESIHHGNYLARLLLPDGKTKGFIYPRMHDIFRAI